MGGAEEGRTLSPSYRAAEGLHSLVSDRLAPQEASHQEAFIHLSISFQHVLLLVKSGVGMLAALINAFPEPSEPERDRLLLPPPSFPAHCELSSAAGAARKHRFSKGFWTFRPRLEVASTVL